MTLFLIYPLWLYKLPVYLCNIFTHSCADGHLCWFWLLAFVCRAAINLHNQVSILWWLWDSRYVPSTAVAGSRGSYNLVFILLVWCACTSICTQARGGGRVPHSVILHLTPLRRGLSLSQNLELGGHPAQLPTTLGFYACMTTAMFLHGC